MSSLYEIAADYAKLMSEDFPVEFIADTVEGMEGEFEDKCENILALIKNESALSEALKAESKSLTERAKAIDKKVSRLKLYIVESMQTIDKKTLNAGIHKLSIRNGVQSVYIEDDEKLPPEFVDYHTVINPNKNLIKEKLKLGKKIDGASLVRGKPSLIIK